MSWLRHPRYIPVRGRLVAYLKSDKYRFRRLAPVVFLCGAANSPRRDSLRDYLKRHFPGISLFYAEQVWMRLVPSVGANALEMEDYLGQLADLVVIIVESAGTFTELGAFSLSPMLRKKLLPVLDIHYRHDDSFIETGPVRWIAQDSDFKPPIYVDQTRILESVDEIEERIGRFPKTTKTRIENLSRSPKHLLFFICDLVAVIGPATSAMIEYYVNSIVPGVSNNQIRTLIGVAAAMNLTRQAEFRLNGARNLFFYRTTDEALTRPFHHKRFLDLPSQRADHVEVLQAIPEAREVLRVVL